jgi:glycosyltransferase involved in cell wall biosynthesis
VIQVSGKNPFVAEPSGTLTYITSLIRALSEKGTDVTLISAQIEDFDNINQNFNHIPIKIKKVTSIQFFLKLMIKAPFLKIPKNSIIHVHRPDFMIPFVIFWRKNLKVCTLHGIPDVGIKTRKNLIIWGIYNILERFSLKHINKLIAVNQSTKEYYTKRQPNLKKKIKIISVGIDLNIFKPMDKWKMREKYCINQEEIVILFIGRFSIEKGLNLLLDTFNDVHSEIPNTRLILLGEGPEGNKLKQIVKTHHIENVTFIDPVKREKIPEIINCSDIFVLSSSFEGMPTVVLEALACGVPVVSTDVGDVKKVVIDGKTGCLIKNRKIEFLKKGLIEVINNGRESYSHNCISIAKKYSWEYISGQICDLYEDVTKSQ